MEKLIQQLPKDRRSPRLWFERLSIFAEPGASNILRTISFHRGMNVVWAKEPTAGSAVGVHAAGHGVGKTSLCLLLRFCLGDPSKSVTVLRDELYSEFPKGGVFAVMHVDGRPHTLCRYFNSHKEGLFCEAQDTDDVWALDAEGSDRDFLKKLAEDMVGSLSPGSIPDTGQAIEWKHVLAWLSRDQGSRFKSFFAWREGEGAGLQRSRQDPPLVMRAALGLLDQSESLLMGRIAALEQELAQALDSMDELRREPELIRRRIESNLRAVGSLPDDLPIRAPDLFSDSVEKRIKTATQAAETRLAKWDTKQEKADQDLAELRAELKRCQSEFERASAEYDFAYAASCHDESSFRSIGKKLLELKNLSGHCDEGNVPFSQCKHVQHEIQLLELSSLRDKRDKQSLQKAMEQSASRTVAALARKNEIGSKVQALEREEQSLKGALNKVRTARRTAEVEANRWPSLLDELARWDESAGSAEAQAKIDAAQAEVDRIKKDLGSARTGLALLHQEQSAREKALAAITDGLTQHLLPDGAFGAFSSRDVERPFRLSMRGGEAYRVLEVLLGDIACLLDSAGPGSSLPGLLIHDCPREADMSIGLYENFLTLIDTLEREGFSGVEPPFQYIVTTTTPPPTSLREGAICLELDPSSSEGLLFHRRFGSEQVELH